MSISPLRQQFLALDAQNAIPKQRIHLSKEEALAELRVERDRVENIQWIDGKADDLNPKEGFVSYRNQPKMDECLIDGSASVFEWTPGNRNRSILEYRSSHSTYGSGTSPQQMELQCPVQESVVMGSNDQNEQTWFALRLTEGPNQLTYEQVSINFADLSKSYKEVWLFNPQG
jgi:hypothetical protein